MSLRLETFETALNARMGHGYDLTYRVREAPDRQSILIEQKVGRGCVDVPLSEGDESYARARDGFGLVLRTLKGSRFPCRSCGHVLSAPVMRFGQIRCEYCHEHGETSLYNVGYFPLCDRLLDHLEQTHPKRGTAWQREHAEENARDLAAGERKAFNALDGAIRDDFRQLIRIPRTYLSDHRTY